MRNTYASISHKASSKIMYKKHKIIKMHPPPKKKDMTNMLKH